MKAAVVFFFSLCFLLLKGHSDGYAAIPYNNFSYSSAQHIEKKQQTRLESTNQDLPVLKDNGLNSKKDEFVSLENEDDDDSVFSRKHVQLAKCFITLAYASILVCFYNYFKNRLPFCRHLSYSSSYKYILQRVLRL